MIGYFLKKRRNTAKKIIDCAVAVLVLYFLKLKKLAKKDVFHLTFEKLDSSKLLNNVVKYCEHRHQLSHREYFLLVLVKYMAKIGQAYVPEISHNNNADLMAAIKQDLPFIAVTVHNGFAFTSKFMSNHNRQVATIVADKNYVKNKVFKRTGITADINLIDRDKYCLVKLLKAINQKVIVCCDIDFPKDKRDKFKFISPTLFFLAHKHHIPIYFARYEISACGELNVVFNGPHTNESPLQKTSEFINYINENRPQKRLLSVDSF
jgi:hypothetical protein